MLPSPPTSYQAFLEAKLNLSQHSGFAVPAPFPLVGICFCAPAHALYTGCMLRPDSQSFLCAGASSLRTKSAFFAAASSLPPRPPLQRVRPQGHKGAVGASKKMGPPPGGHLPRCLATPRSERFFMIILRGQRDTPASSPCGGQDVR